MIGELEEKIKAKDSEIIVLRKKIATVLAEHNIGHTEFSAYKEADHIKSDSGSRVNSLQLKSRSKSPFIEDRHGHISEIHSIPNSNQRDEPNKAKF